MASQRTPVDTLPWARGSLGLPWHKFGVPAAIVTAALVGHFDGAALLGASADAGSIEVESPGSQVFESPAAQFVALAAERIADRWDIPEDDAAMFARNAVASGAEYRIDPALVLAVIAVESDFVHFGNPHQWLRGDETRVNPLVAHGPMQVAGRYHKEKFPLDSRGRIRVTSVEENIRIGTRILREYLDWAHGDVALALQKYNGNVQDQTRRYARAVLASREEINEGSAGAVRVALKLAQN